jgi:hypothetical protein
MLPTILYLMLPNHVSELILGLLYILNPYQANRKPDILPKQI